MIEKPSQNLLVGANVRIGDALGTTGVIVAYNPGCASGRELEVLINDERAENTGSIVSCKKTDVTVTV